MTLPSLRDYARAEAEWLCEPENRIDAVCQWCLHEPCTCDEEYDEYRDYLMERDER